MRTLDEIRAELRAMLPELRQHYPVAALGVFGPYARAAQRLGSDLDLLVDFDGPIGIFAFLSLKAELARRLGAPADLVSRPALKPVIGAQLLQEFVAV